MGKGKLVMSKVNDFGGNGISSMIVEEGLVKKGSGATCGAQYSRIVVEDGAQFDLNGRTYYDYDYTLAGSGPGGTGVGAYRTFLGNMSYSGAGKIVVATR